MRYFIFSAHGGIGYHAALRILEQPANVCTFLVPFADAETWSSDPRLARSIATKSALLVTGDAKNIDDLQRAWHTAEMGIDSECSGIEAVIISDLSTQRHLTDAPTADELLSLLKCFPGYPYPPFQQITREPAYTPRPRSSYIARTPPLHMPRSPSYSLRCPRLVLVSPSRSLKRLRTGPRGSTEEHLLAWATGKKSNSTTTYTASPGTEPGTPIHSDAHSIHSSYSGTHSSGKSLFPEEQRATGACGGWLDPKHTLIVRPAVLIRKRCRGDDTASAVPYRIQEEFTLRDRGGGWTISKRDVAHFIVARALEEWSSWGGRRVRIAY